MRQLVTVLDAQVAAQLTADAPEGLNVTAPSSEAYFVLPNERAIREHVAAAEGHVQVYLYPSSTRTRRERTGSGTTKSPPSQIEISVVVRVHEEAGAADFDETWKTLSPKEREFLRCETILGAIQDVIDGYSRADDVLAQVWFVDSRSGDERFGSTGTVGVQRWLVQQIITIPVQSS